MRDGMPVVGREEIARAVAALEEYRRCKNALERRIVENEQWFRLRHWDCIRRSANGGDPEPASAWLLNCIANKHADAMDNFPRPAVLAREKGDMGEAKALSAILPVILEQNDFEETYSDVWWYKLKTGTGVYGVFWSSDKCGGLGDVDIRRIDLLNLFWQPGITDIQSSRNLFNVELWDDEVLVERYPELEGNLGAGLIDVKRYVGDDAVDVSGKTAVVDWYYKRRVGGRETVHYCKFCNSVVLYASENDPEYAERGFYDHGLYPFVFDRLFVEEGSPVGFGYVDVCKDAQLYIDKLNQVVLKNAVMAARPRWFVRGDGSVNEDEYADWEKDFVHFNGAGDPEDSIKQIVVRPLSDVYVAVLNGKIEELKETSGNRDFSQGGVNSGVTAASAIAALQEAGTKLSRDMVKSGYRAFSKVNYLCVELIRQFYDEPRSFRIAGKEGETDFASYSNERIRPVRQDDVFGLDMGYRAPVFDISVRSERMSPFSTVAENDRAKELFALGFFKPENAAEALCALEMMDFQGRDVVRERIIEGAEGRTR